MIFIVDSLGYGGSERTVQVLANNLKSNIKIITISNRVSYSINKNIKVEKVFNKDINGILRTIYLPYIIWLIIKRNEILKDDVIVSFHFTSNIINIIIKMFKKNKAIICERQYSKNYFGWKNIIVWPLISILYNKADKIICNDVEIEYELKRFYNIKNRIVVLNNLFVPPKDIIEKNEDRDKKFKFITIGRLSKEKNVIDCIKAFELISDKNNELIIIGKGKQEKYLKKYVNKKGINKFVKFIGNTNNPYKYLNNSDLFIMTSLNEGFPNVVLEAMYYGLPIISYKYKAGISTILSDGKYGVLVPTHDIKKFSQEMQKFQFNKLYYDYYKKMSEKRIIYFMNKTKYLTAFNKVVNFEE